MKGDGHAATPPWRALTGCRCVFACAPRRQRGGGAEKKLQKIPSERASERRGGSARRLSADAESEAPRSSAFYVHASLLVLKIPIFSDSSHFSEPPLVEEASGSRLRPLLARTSQRPKRQHGCTVHPVEQPPLEARLFFPKGKQG